MNKRARLAWELYLKMETSGESFSLLQLVANDCYKVYKCFDRLRATTEALLFFLRKTVTAF